MRIPLFRTRATNRRRFSALLVALATVLSACGEADSVTGTPATAPVSEPTPETTATTPVAPAEPESVVSFIAADYLIDPPSEPVRPGAVTIEFENNGEDFHHLQLWRFDDAASAAAAIEAGDLSVLATGDAVGGVGAIEGLGTVGTLATVLEAGEYVSFCVIDTPAGAHHELGMVETFTVAGDRLDTELPATDTTLTITPYGFVFPDDWDGEAPLRVVNANDFPADAEFLRLAPGKTRDDFFAFIDGGPGPPPFTVAGGVSGLGPNGEVVLPDGIEPGEYLVASFQPDPTREMVPQFLTGYLTAVEVS